MEYPVIAERGGLHWLMSRTEPGACAEGKDLWFMSLEHRAW